MKTVENLKNQVKNLFEASEYLDSAGFEIMDCFSPTIALSMANDDYESLSTVLDEMRVEMRYRGTDVQFFRSTDRSKFFELIS